jgi:hypothetical protein
VRKGNNQREAREKKITTMRANRKGIRTDKRKQQEEREHIRWQFTHKLFSGLSFVSHMTDQLTQTYKNTNTQTETTAKQERKMNKIGQCTHSRVTFEFMDEEEEMRAYVEQFPGKVNDCDGEQDVLIRHAAATASPSFVAELVDTYGTNVRGCSNAGVTALHSASSAAMISVLLERGASLLTTDYGRKTPLMHYTSEGLVDCVERALQEKWVLVTINEQDYNKFCALHHTFSRHFLNDTTRAEITKLLLLAGADPHIQDKQGRTPLQYLQATHPKDNSNQASKSILQEATLDDGRTFLLHKARHLSDAAHALKETISKTLAKTAPPPLSSRMQPSVALMMSHLPCIELAPESRGNNETEEEQKKRRAVLQYVLGLEHGGGVGNGGNSGDGANGMPLEVFVKLLKMIGPSWYPVADGAGSVGAV